MLSCPFKRCSYLDPTACVRNVLNFIPWLEPLWQLLLQPPLHAVTELEGERLYCDKRKVKTECETLYLNNSCSIALMPVCGHATSALITRVHT